jgi:hypothetical protein
MVMVPYPGGNGPKAQLLSNNNQLSINKNNNFKHYNILVYIILYYVIL